MAVKFNDRVFGADIDQPIKDKIRARQFIAGKRSSTPFESHDIKYDRTGKPVHISNIFKGSWYGGEKIQYDVKGGEHLEISKTPWVRMWTALQVYNYTPPVEDTDYARTTFSDKETSVQDEWPKFEHMLAKPKKDNYTVTTDSGKTKIDVERYNKDVNAWNLKNESLDGTSKVTYKKSHRTRHTKTIKEEKTETMETNVYIVGNNEFHVLTNGTQGGPYEGLNIVQGQKKYKGVGNSSAADLFDKPMEKNEFMRPDAGILSVDTTTDGALGSIQNATIRFVVYNFEDFQNIYNRYFLRPGAQIMLDMGWDTQTPYSIQNTIAWSESRRDSSGENATEYMMKKIFEEQKNSEGDLCTFVGRVYNYSTQTREDGSFECQLHIVSGNAGLIEHANDEEAGFRDAMTQGLNFQIAKIAGDMLGKNMVTPLFTSDVLGIDATQRYANAFIKGVFSGDSMSTNIPESNQIVGVYYLNSNNPSDSINVEDPKIYAQTEDNQESPEETERIEKEAKAKADLNKLTEWTTDDDEKLYISWGFFEDQILNRYLGIQHDDVLYQSQFDSSNTFVRWDKDLLHRQRIMGRYDKEISVDFLIPEKWDHTYNTIYDRMPDVGDGRHNQMNSSSYKKDQTTWTDYDKERDRIPFREIFIKVELIRDAFSTKKTVSDALKFILDSLKTSSYDLFNLQFWPPSEAYEKLAIVDTNKPSFDSTISDLANSADTDPSTLDKIEEKFEDLVTFKPYSPESIVTHYDINYMTGNNALQSMIMITNVDLNQQIFPVNTVEHQSQALRIMNNHMGGRETSNITQGLGIRYLPSSDHDMERETLARHFLSSTGMNQWYDESNTVGVSSNYSGWLSKNLGGGTVSRDTFSELMQGGESFINKYLWDYTPPEVAESNFLSEIEEDPDKDYITKEDYGMGVSGVDYQKYLYAKNLDDYFSLKVRHTYNRNVLSLQLPFEVNLTIHGMSGLYPGDVFKVDYLPKEARQRQYFMITNIRHQLTEQTWTTTITSVPRFIKLKEDMKYYKIPQDVFIHPNYFSGQVNDYIFEYFKNFKLSDLGSYQTPVFTAEGNMTGEIDQEQVWGDERNGYTYWDLYQVHLPYNVTKFSQVKINTSGYMEANNAPNWESSPPLRGHTSNIKENEKYILVQVGNGFLAFPVSSGIDDQQITNIAIALSNFIKINRSTLITDMKKQYNKNATSSGGSPASNDVSGVENVTDESNANVLPEEEIGSSGADESEHVPYEFLGPVKDREFWGTIKPGRMLWKKCFCNHLTQLHMMQCIKGKENACGYDSPSNNPENCVC